MRGVTNLLPWITLTIILSAGTAVGQGPIPLTYSLLPPVDDVKGEGADALALVPPGVTFEAEGAVVPYADQTLLLPAAPDPNYFLSSPSLPVAQLGAAYGLPARFLWTTNLFSRVGGSASLSAIYDTGFIDGNLTPSHVALAGSDASRKSSHFSMSSFDATSKLQWDVQLLKSPGTPQTQALVELEVSEETVRARRSYAWIVSDSAPVREIVLGLAPSFASDEYALPTSLSRDVVPVGALRKNVARLSIGRDFGQYFSAGFGVENPGDDFRTTNADDVRLSRYPTLVGRVRCIGLNRWDSLQVAGLVRWFGQENVAREEDWVNGWGVAAVARKMIVANRDFVYLGAAGGDGVGDYIFGIESGAGPGAGGLTALSGFGAYAGLAHVWFGNANCGNLWSNFVAGYSYQGDAAGLPGDSIRRSRQAFVNLIYQRWLNTAVGIEYHYLDRDVQSGATGNNHRIQFVVMVGTAAPKESETEVAALGFAPSAKGYRAPVVTPSRRGTMSQRRL